MCLLHPSLPARQLAVWRGQRQPAVEGPELGHAALPGVRHVRLHLALLLQQPRPAGAATGRVCVVALLSLHVSCALHFFCSNPNLLLGRPCCCKPACAASGRALLHGAAQRLLCCCFASLPSASHGMARAQRLPGCHVRWRCRFMAPPPFCPSSLPLSLSCHCSSWWRCKLPSQWWATAPAGRPPTASTSGLSSRRVAPPEMRAGPRGGRTRLIWQRGAAA